MEKDFVDISVFQMYNNNTNRVKEKTNGKIRDTGEISARPNISVFSREQKKSNGMEQNQKQTASFFIFRLHF